MNNIINELHKFSNNVIEIGSPINDNRIEVFEKKYNIVLPTDFKKFMVIANGFNLMGVEVYSFDNEKSESIENIYYFEHFEVIIPQYPDFVPFSSDGRGNFYCLDTKNKTNNGNCKIIFWASNYQYTVDDFPEVTNENFLEWVKEVAIEWTLENYNYDGTEK